jgi:hypothetical protein
MIASDNNTFGLAQRTPPEQKKGYKDTVRYHQLGKKEQEKVAAVASMAASAVGAFKQENKTKTSQLDSVPNRTSRSLPTSPRQVCGDTSFPIPAKKPTLAPKPNISSTKPVVSSVKPNKPPRPASLQHVGSEPVSIRQKPTQSRTTCDATVPTPPLKEPNSALPLSDQAQVDPKPTGGSENDVQLRTRPSSVPFESKTDSPVILPEMCRQTLIDDRSPESSPDMASKKSHPLSVSDDNDSFSDSSSFDSEESSSKQVNDTYINVNFNVARHSVERRESAISEEAGQSEEEKQKRKLFKIAEEILTTERTYVNSLKLLVEVCHNFITHTIHLLWMHSGFPW